MFLLKSEYPFHFNSDLTALIPSEVASFTGEKQAIEKYNRSLKSAYKASVLEGLAAGFGLGATIAIIICGYGLGVWFGSEMIRQKGYTGGDVINVIFAVVTGSM